MEYYRKAAKDLRRAFHAAEAKAVERVTDVLGARAEQRFLLTDAQHVLAQEHGFRSWGEFRRDIARRRAEPDRPVWRLGTSDVTAYEEQAQMLVEAVSEGRPTAVQRVRAHLPRLAEPEADLAGLELREVRLVVAREYGFSTWREMVAYVRKEAGEQVAEPSAEVTAALSAIAAGDAECLGDLLHESPNLAPWSSASSPARCGCAPRPPGCKSRRSATPRRCSPRPRRSSLKGASSTLDRQDRHDGPFVAALNDDSRAEVTPEEFPELFMSPAELEGWAAQRNKPGS